MPQYLGGIGRAAFLDQTRDLAPTGKADNLFLRGKSTDHSNHILPLPRWDKAVMYKLRTPMLLGNSPEYSYMKRINIPL